MPLACFFCTEAFEWLKKRHRHAKTTVQDMWTAHVHLLHPDQVQQATSTFTALHREFQNEGVSAANIVTVGFLNWVAPCMLKSETLEHQANQVAYLLSSSETNICPILCPQFSYKKGQLYLSEQMMQKLLSCRQVNFDSKWGLRFENRPDSRDTRPLLYEGRMGIPNGVNDQQYFWHGCSLLRGITEPAQMVTGKHLQIIHDVSDHALPVTTDIDGTVKGGSKFAQVGEDAMMKILDALLDAPKLTPSHAVIFWDIHSGVGNLLDAIVEKAASWRFRWCYLGICDNVEQFNWLQHSRKERMVERLLQGKLQITGHQPLPSDQPAELRISPPQTPDLHCLAVQSVFKAGSDVGQAIDGDLQVKRMTLAVPDNLIKTWAHHKQHGPAFQKMLEEFHEEFNDLAVVLPAPEAGPTTNTTKRRAPGEESHEAGAKVRRVDPSRVISCEDMPTQGELLSAEMVQKNQSELTLKVFVGYSMYVVNDSAAEQTLHAGSVLAGFGKGKFKAKADTKEEENTLKFSLSSSDDLVLHKSKLLTVGAVLAEKKQSDPQAKVAYHDLEEVPGNLGDFKLTMKVPIQFTWEEENAKDKQLSAGCYIPSTSYEQPGLCQCIWATRWCVQGLAPVRPFLVLLKDVTLGSKKALQIAPRPATGSEAVSLV